MKELQMVTHYMLKEKRDILFSILAGAIAGLAAVGLFSASGYLLSQAALKTPLYALVILTSSVKLLGFIRAAFRYVERYYSHRATFTILSNLRTAFFEKLEPITPRITGKFRSGDLLARITGDIETLQHYFLRVFYPPIVLCIIFLCTLLFTLYFSVATSLILLIGLILTTFLVPMYVAFKQHQVKSRLREQRGYLATETTELLQGFRDLKIHQKLADKEIQLNTSSHAYIQAQEKEASTILFGKSINNFLALFITWAVLGTGAYLITAGALDGVFLAMLLMITMTVFDDIDMMAVFPIYLEDSKEAVKRLKPVVLGEKDAASIQKNTLVLPADTPFSFNLENVHFTFSNEWRETLTNISLHLPAGSKTAIVGPSGSGKSALFQLLLHLYEKDAGSLLVNGTAIDEAHAESLWNTCNVVLQENHFFYGTIKSNLQLAGDNLRDADMESVLSKVHLSRFSLSDPVLEKGENLSGGEKQRLAIARALLKNKRNWFFDEPASSMDAITERAIFQQIFKQAKEDTLVLISHRLHGLEMMDQIIVMDQGKIIESGTYEALMNKQGYFYNMKEIENSLF